MNTPTHLLVGLAAFGRRGRPDLTSAALLGALTPDASLYLMFAWQRLVNGRTPQQIFEQDYFSPFWQGVFAIDNSAPLYTLLVLIALGFSGFSVRRALSESRWTGPLLAFAGAALLHIALDLPLHHDDGRPHFWPFSDWVFKSPISYWDPLRYGGVVSVAETVMVLVLGLALIRRYRSLWSRIAIGVVMALQALTAVLWVLLL